MNLIQPKREIVTMAVNIKFNEAVAGLAERLSKPAEERHGITGFWRANLRRVQNQQVIRLADMTRGRFLLEAEIDSETTHEMEPERMEEYIDHQLFEVQLKLAGRPPDEIRRARDNVRELLHRCDRVVIGFRNARFIAGRIQHLGKNPICKSYDEYPSVCEFAW